MRKLLTKTIGTWLNLLAYIAPKLAARKGFNLFCTPMAAPVKDYQRKFYDTAEKSTFVLDGVVIQTYRWGQGAKKILFLHGWQSHTFRWKNYIESFPKEEYAIYALDAPAHGLSGGKYITLPLYTKVIQSFIASVKPLHAAICHSFGGFAMLYAFYNDPALPVQRVVLMGTPGEASDFMKFYQDVLGLSSRAMKLVNDYFIHITGHPIGFYSAPKFAGAVTVPGLIIHDEKDADAPYQYAIRINEAWKNSTLITTSGLGHNLKSKEVISTVRDFVSEKEKPAEVRS